MRFLLNEKKSKEIQTILIKLVLKTKADLKEGPDNIIVVFGLSFLLVDWLSFGEGSSFEFERPRSRSWKNFGRRWTRGMKSLKN